MSHTLMTQSDIPKYIMEEITTRRLRICNYRGEQKHVCGYTFRIFGKFKRGYEQVLPELVEQIIAWARSYHAEAYITEDNMYFHHGLTRSRAEHSGWHNNYVLTITDPVAKQLEIAISQHSKSI